jgi:hypothetical protein
MMLKQTKHSSDSTNDLPSEVDMENRVSSGDGGGGGMGTTGIFLRNKNILFFYEGRYILKQVLRNVI